MVRSIYLIAMMVTTFSSFAGGGGGIQDRSTLFRASLTISPGYLLSQQESTIYLQGMAEYFVSEKVSIIGDGFWLTPKSAESGSLRQSVSGLFGAAYHFMDNGLIDPWVGLQPGIAQVAMYNQQDLLTSETSITPVVSISTGLTLQVNRWFYLFGQARFVSGNADLPSTFDSKLNEIRGSFGLGFSFISDSKCNTCPTW